MKNLSNKLLESVDKAKHQLLALKEEEVDIKPNPDKWSKKEILGHLIDSAANNHRRFMIAQFKDDLIFSGYAQDQWVEYQDYQNAEWQNLIDLWTAYNIHLARVIQYIPKGILYRPCEEHNLHLVAFKLVPETETTTLAYFVEDYINHLEHHIGQILS